MDDAIPAQVIERPVHRRRRSLLRVSAAPAVAHERPADLRPGPPLRHPRAEPPNPSTGRPFDDGEHRDARGMPGADHGHQPAPRKRARHDAADEARGLLVGHHLGPRVEVLAARHAKHEARGCDLQIVEVHARRAVTLHENDRLACRATNKRRVINIVKKAIDSGATGSSGFASITRAASWMTWVKPKNA